jgi:hypothetical protein
VVEFGKNLVQNETVGAAGGLWVPLLIMALGSTVSFLRTARRLPDQATTDPLSALAAVLRPLERVFSRNGGVRR